MLHRLDHRAGHYLLLIAVWAAVCLPNLGGPSLWDIDEGNNATCFREMLTSSNFLVPTFNGNLREDKPVLIYWLQIASAQLFGVNEWAGRFPSAMAALLTVIVLYELGRQMFGVRQGLLAGVILATSMSVIGAAHFANPDALLLAFNTCALVLFWHDYRTGGRGWLAGVGIASGLAVLTKGPVGVVLPAAVALLFLAWQRQLRRLWDLRVVSLILVFILVAAPWYVWVGVETKGAWLLGFWNKHNVQRALTPLENHSGMPYYYLLMLLLGLAPWSIFAGATAWHTWRGLRGETAETGKNGDEQAAARFLFVWIAVYVVFFSVVQTKLPNYILPAYPAAALLTAHLLERWRRGEVVLPVWLVRAGLACLASIGVAATVALVVASGLVEARFMRGRVFPGLASLVWIGVVPAAGAVVGSWLFDRGRRTAMIAALALTSVLFAAPTAGLALEGLEQQKAARSLAQALPEDQTRREVRLAACCYFQPSLVFYCQREVARCDDLGQALAFLEGSLPSFLFVPETVWAQIQPQLPVKSRVLARRHDLYSGQMILLVTNECPR